MPQVLPDIDPPHFQGEFFYLLFEHTVGGKGAGTLGLPQLGFPRLFIRFSKLLEVFSQGLPRAQRLRRNTDAEQRLSPILFCAAFKTSIISIVLRQPENDVICGTISWLLSYERDLRVVALLGGRVFFAKIGLAT